MVAAHILDLRAAASYGLKTVYIPRPGEGEDNVKSKAEGGEVDLVVSCFTDSSGFAIGSIEGRCAIQYVEDKDSG